MILGLSRCTLNCTKVEARFPSGQRGQTVNLLAYAFEGSNPSLATILRQLPEIIALSRPAESAISSFCLGNRLDFAILGSLPHSKIMVTFW